MFNLFWKIFLIFWIAMIAMGGAIAWTTAQIGRERIPLMIEREKEQFAQSVAEAESVLRTRGLAGFREWLDDTWSNRRLNVFLIDPSGREVLGNELPPHLARIIDLLRARGFVGEARPWIFGPPPSFGGPPDGRYWRGGNDLDDAGEGGPEHHGLIIRSVAVPREGYFHLIAVFRPPHPVWHLVSIPGLLAALLISGAVCLGLARYLSAPVRRLRTATQALAAGNLGIRVGTLGLRGDEMGGLSRDFDRMAARLQALIEAQKELLRDVSHELRSPLARLQVALGLARRRSEGRAAEELDRIEREAERLNEMIGQILSLTRLAVDAGEHMREPVDLAVLVDSIARDAAFEAEQAHRHVRVLASAAVTFTGNPELLHSAVENVVRNAVHYTREGTAVEIALARDEDDGQVVITVRDHGPGVGEPYLQRIFEPFFRASESRDRASGGYGLGLAIAKRAVELHGGAIGAVNAPDGGLRVTIRLPLA
ncbi:MAG: HAMP domain-containing protein [Gammaproteobacteria bacterium]|nr:HAMP domain-containing protein [Gammaproteobacteria bacterium]